MRLKAICADASLYYVRKVYTNCCIRLLQHCSLKECKGGCSSYERAMLRRLELIIYDM